VRVAVVGCGLIGTRRAEVAAAAGDDVVCAVDLDAQRARRTAALAGGEPETDWRRAVESDVDIVTVSTVNRDLMPITVAALEAGKHVLCEKPLGRNAAEARAMVDAARRHQRILKTGFNHRHHPAIAQAHEIAQAGGIGEPRVVRAAYGHGGRLGYDQEWRANPELAGGGELLDQGVHVVDLCRWFLGEFSSVIGNVSTLFWDVAPLEDNAFALLRSESGTIASFHTSWTQWRNLFRFELFGPVGSLVVDGLGGSYGVERLTHFERRPEGGAPKETEWTYPGPDLSWKLEWEELLSAIAEGREPLGSGEDGLRAAQIVDAIYASADAASVIPL
jgi:predicted dehydrogenase